MQMDTEVSEDERARNAVRNLFARQAVISADAYRRLLKPSIETEFASLSKEQADDEAIRVFAENLRQLLLAPPLGPVVRWSASMHKAIWYTMKTSILTRR